MNELIEVKYKVDSVNKYIEQGISAGIEFKSFGSVITGIEFQYTERLGVKFVKISPVNENGYIRMDGRDIFSTIEFDYEKLNTYCDIEKDKNIFKYCMKLFSESKSSDEVTSGIIISSEFEGYKKYLSTAHWDSVRAGALSNAKYKCQLCGKTEVELHVHHNNYENLCNEDSSDLIVLCKDCHEKFHNINKGGN